MMQYKGYPGKVEFDADAQILRGDVVGIRDVVTFQGSSVNELKKAFRDSVDDYLAFCSQRGEAPDKPHSGQFIVRIDSDLHRKANMLASASGKSLNSLFADAVAKEVAHEWPSKSDKRSPTTGRRRRNMAL